MSSFAAGKHALGICDRSGFTYKLKDLVFEVQDGKLTGLRVGKDMLDPDHPQNFLGRYPVDDPQALRGARPDSRTDSSSNASANWNPVGDRNSLQELYGFSTQTSLQASGQVGSVTVSVS
tara:strand:- start:1028 stop:1387 length:360 start_codon:yes stop_codon:yes gene_type:complete